MSKNLTVREKETWIRIIGDKIQASIDQINKDNADLIESMKGESKVKAVKALGLDTALDTITTLLEDAQTKTDKLVEHLHEIHGSLRVTKKDDYCWRRRNLPESVNLKDEVSGYLNDIGETVQEKADAIFEAAVKDHPVLSRTKDLEAAKAEVHNAVWLATSPDALSGLWAKFSKKLSLELTDLEKMAAE